MNKKTIKIDINKTELKIGEKSLIFGDKTYIMGILNVTPDSFSDGGDFVDTDKAVEHAKKMLAEGAHMIDVGGESTRPGFTSVPEDEEIRRIVPVIKRLKEETEAIISVDTTKATVAEEAIKNGGHIINDIWGLQKDKEMIAVAAKYQVPVIVMHNQDGTEYHGDMVASVVDFLKESINIAIKGGLKKENIILDPGIGFGKTPEQNMEMMARLSEIRDMGYPVLLGTSRKSMIGKILDVPPRERCVGTVATTVMGVMQGMDIVRVHDVLENAQAAKVADSIVRK
ncbi:dihydropteroate synthase [Alkalibacter saccharofermentans]|uniref:Dihydropteroate synthase n=1 Tax=Alkalibacter saccharofermentans DSM 14828 TaxID=1120975 RepID=A0A1M4TQ23_9FIRM|nr:dihydropteroate synthase [Alkalibacter saccharofermentans DSM 14828]